MPKTSAKKPPAKKAKKKLAILGFTDSRLEAPFDDNDCEIWGLNGLHNLNGWSPPRFTRWFDLHDDRIIEQYSESERRWFETCPTTLYVWNPKDEWPNAIAYPKPEIVKTFGTYFTNSISWMLALAIAEGFEWIGIYGVDMAQGTEYCVSPESRILTKDLRWVTADQVRVGDELVGFEEYPTMGNTYREYRKSIVQDVQYLTRPSHRLTMSDGTKLVSSQEHRWLRYEAQSFKWWETGDLQHRVVTDQLCQTIYDRYHSLSRRERAKNKVTVKSLAEEYGISWSMAQRITSDRMPDESRHGHQLIKLTDVWDTDRSYDAGYLAAALDGEGHLSMRSRKPANRNGTNVVVGFAQRENAMAEEFERIILAKGMSAHRHKAKEGTLKYSIRGGRSELLRLLGSVRPKRLLDIFDPNKLGILHAKDTPEIVENEYMGDIPVVGIKTDTGTFICEGYASHNSGQRPSCEYFIGLAKGLGIEIEIPKTSDLLKTIGLYGFDDNSDFVAKLKARVDELKSNYNSASNSCREAEATMFRLEGALETTQYILGTWAPASVKREGSDDGGTTGNA